MTRVVGTGCALSAVVAARPRRCRETGWKTWPPPAADEAGREIAARQGGPGSFIPAFLDALYQEVQG